MYLIHCFTYIVKTGVIPFKKENLPRFVFSFFVVVLGRDVLTISVIIIIITTSIFITPFILGLLI